MSMDPKLVAFIAFTPGTPPVVAKAYNCSVARVADGDYNITLGEGGADSSVCVPSVTPATAAAGGATSARIPSVIQTSDTVKRVQTRDDAGTLANAAFMWVSFERIPAF